MTKYTIANLEIEISTDVENYRYYQKATNPFVGQAGSIFENWYSKHNDCFSVYQNRPEVVMLVIDAMLEKGVQILNDQGVYSIDSHSLFEKCAAHTFDEFMKAAEDMMDEYEQVEEDKRREAEYRQYRKASRGRVVGGGFGLGGAVKGMMTAGAINMVTGTAHSLANTVGNVGSSVSAGINKQRIYSKYKNILKEGCIEGARHMQYNIMKLISETTGISFHPVTKDEANVASAILVNYQDGRIPGKNKAEQITYALTLNPRDEEIYFAIWDDFGDRNGDLTKMADYFGVGFADKIEALVCDNAQKIFERNCKRIIVAKNELAASIEAEEDIRKTIKEIKDYCNQKGTNVANCSSVIKRCERLLEQADIHNRTVKKVMYDSKDCANAVREDYKIFYAYLRGKAVLDNELLSNLSNMEFKSRLFLEKLQDIYAEEIERRNIEMTNSFVQDLVHKYSDNQGLLGQILVWGINDELRGMETQLANITKMAHDETPIIVFKGDKKGKSGFLISNYCLRSYSSGVFSSENRCMYLENITNIVCRGEDTYTIHLTSNSTENINFKKGDLSIIEQNDFAEMIQEIVLLMQNIPRNQREQIYRLYHSTYKCTCGEYLLPEEKICPSCKKIMNAEGHFVESQICPGCGKYVVKSKKFCPGCGRKLVDAENIHIPSTSDEDIVKQTGYNGAEEGSVITRCPQCGNEVKSGKKFCIYCGTTLLTSGISHQEYSVGNKANIQIDWPAEQVKSAVKRCLRCGNVIKVGKKFCTKCGIKVE